MTRTTIRSEDITAGQVKAADLASDAVDTTGIQTDIAILGFKVAANGSLAKYNLVDQTIDDFQDATGVDASASSGEFRNDSNYYSGFALGSYTFTALTTAESSTWTVPTDITSVEALVVAGGGAGGQDGAGGGGAGGIVHHTSLATTPAASISYTVGAGGTSAPWGGKIGTSGANSVFGSITAIGGGFGGAYTDDKNGADGGSGGGGSQASTVAGSGGTGTQGDSGGGTGYGNDGGNGGYFARSVGGGGGGASAVGAAAASGPISGNGGAGKLFSNFVAYGTDVNNVASTGSNGGYFGGGGAGSIDGAGTFGEGGVGGGGDGDDSNQHGLVNTGGGGGATDGTTSGTGGVGFIGLRYRTETAQDLTLISNSTTAEAVPTKGDLVMTYTNGAGTATVNTDIKAWVSRDNGTTYTQFTLTDDGDTGGHTILTAHNVDISSQPSGTSMRYKIETLNQSASKETRIQAVSLGWS